MAEMLILESFLVVSGPGRFNLPDQVECLDDVVMPMHVGDLG
jgi:hypothetical protein